MVRARGSSQITQIIPQLAATRGPPMTLGNMRELGVRNLIASCLNDACRHTALIDVSNYPAETEVPSFRGPNAAWASAFTRRCSNSLHGPA